MGRGDGVDRPVAFRPTVAEVDAAAIRHNARKLKPPGVELMAVVKANGYGHGAVPVARAALEGGATWLGVALVEEGIALRNAGIEAPILVLSEFPPGSETAAVAAGLTPSLYTEDGLALLSHAPPAAGAGGPVRVHVKVDTGMHRVGADPPDVARLARAALDAGFELEGLWTHLATSEEASNAFTREQLDRFRSVVADMERVGIPRPRYLHAANTGGVLAWPDAHLQMVRVGIGLYGITPGPDVAADAGLRPAMSVRSAVTMTRRLAAGERVSYGLRYALGRDAIVATVPIGYADGYTRRLSGNASVLIRGLRRPVAGTVTMDQLMVDCGEGPVEPGDEVVLLGAQGGDCIAAEELASWSGTIGYEIVCGFTDRIPRIVVDGASTGVADLDDAKGHP
jgi:alanine racemase